MSRNVTENNKIMTFLDVLEEKNDLFLNFSGGYLKLKEGKKHEEIKELLVLSVEFLVNIYIVN